MAIMYFENSLYLRRKYHELVCEIVITKSACGCEISHKISCEMSHKTHIIVI